MAANRSRQAQGYRFFPHPPSYLRTTPGFGPPCLEKAWITAGVAMSSAIFAERHEKGKGPHSGGRPSLLLLLFFPSFFPTALARQRFLHALLFAGLQVKGVALHFLDDVLLLYLALEAAQRVLKGFSLLQSDFRQMKLHPQTRPFWTRIVIARFIAESQELSVKLSLRSKIVAPHDRTPLTIDLRRMVSLF
jgi:hypothetical protein